MNTIAKYLRLLKGFFIASAIADLEYRFNFVLKVGTDIAWYVAQFSVFEVLFHHTRQISGWTLDSTRVFMALLFVTDSLWMVLVSENLDRLSDKVRKGELDFVLMKPVNSQFMMSLQKMNPSYLGNFILTSLWLIRALRLMPGGVDWARFPWLLILIPCGICLIYTTKFFFSATALIFTRAENINYIFYQLYRLGMRPDSIYPTWLRWVVFTILPVAFVASVPARVILSQSPVYLVGIAVIAATIGLALSAYYWKFALKFYSSASS